MKKQLLLAVLVIVLIGIISGCAPEPEVKMKELKVAVVDQDQLWGQSKKAENYQEELNAKVEELKQDYNPETENSPKQEDAYQEINEYRQQLKEKFREDIAKAVEDIAEEQGYDLVLNKDEIRYGGEDITEEVLDHL
ncbi:MAG: OmpH family outer membrane protein [Bacillota bacterium]